MNQKRPHDETPKSDRRPKKAVKGTPSELPPLPPAPYTRPKAVISDVSGILSPRHDIGKRKGRKSLSKVNSEEFRKKQCQTLLQRIQDNIILEKKNMDTYQQIIQEFSFRRSALKTDYERIMKDSGELVNSEVDFSTLATVGYIGELFSLLTIPFCDESEFDVDPEVFAKANLAEKTDSENRDLLNLLQSDLNDGLTRSRRQLDILNNFIR